MTFSSDSSTQRSAERLILDAVAHEIGVPLTPQRLILAGGAVVEVDGAALDQSVLVEVFAHQGQLKGGQLHKIRGDILKLITIARELTPRPRLVLAFSDPGIGTFLEGRSWLAAAVKAWEVEVMVAELDDTVREGIRQAQARQVMVNPSAPAV